MAFSYAHKIDDSDLPVAVCWLYVSAVQGNATAQAEYALMELSGSGTAKNQADAFMWAKKSAIQNDYEGECILAILYANGVGTTEDQAKAQFWKTRALAHPEIAARSKPGTSKDQQTDSEAVMNFVAGFFQQYVAAPAARGDVGNAMSILDELTETVRMPCSDAERHNPSPAVYQQCEGRDRAYAAWKRKSEANSLQK